MSTLENKLASLSSEQRAALAKRLKNKQGKSGQSPCRDSIPQRQRSEDTPLSHAQQRLWFLDQMDPGSPLYNLHLTLDLKGSLDTIALQKSLDVIIERHESLRTIFRTENNLTIQKVLPEHRLHIKISDLSHLPPWEREKQARSVIIDEASIPFDLSDRPPLRASLLKLEKDHHVFFIIIHHIIVDGWSLGIFQEELEKLYDGFCRNTVPGLPDLPIQYTDFSLWQREYLQDHMIERQFNYWREKMSGAAPLLDLPSDKPRPAVKTINGARQSVFIDDMLTRKLNELCRKEQVTLYMVLLSAYQILLHRYSGKDDIIVGSPIAGRIRPEFENLIGFFVNALIMRTDLSGNPSFLELLKRVQKTALEAYDNQDIPFEKLVEKLKPQRNLSYSPIYQVAFAFQNMHIKPIRLRRLSVSTLEIDRGTAAFDLSLFVLNTERGLKVMMEYNTDLFEHQTAERMLGHYLVLLNAIVETPGESIGKLPLLKKDERETMLSRWNQTQADYPRDKSLVALFQEQAGIATSKIAVANEEGGYTYGQLNEMANQLARHLIAQGGRPGEIIGLCLDRSIEMFVGMLGILKTGAAYLPLDPDYPRERLKFMARDCNVSRVVTLEKHRDITSGFHTKTISLDMEWHEIAIQPGDNLDININPGDLCYVIYTSGSTGMPKGVLIEHGNIVHSTCARMDYYPDPVERFILLSSFSFDSSVAGIFWTLCQGGTLVLPGQGDEKDLHKIATLIHHHQPSHMLCLPSVHGLLLDTASPGQLSSLRTVIVAGETCPVSLVQKHAEKLPHSRLYNEYGPTEGTVWSTVYSVDLQNPPRHHIPIGKPIQNVQAYILDKNLQAVPIGVTGELHIAGEGLARGYLNNDVYNRTKFIRLPLHEGGRKTRLYKTGDLARYLPDGNIVYMGRTDAQVKLRGYRIELGEIESAIATHPKVRETAVIVREDRPGDKRLTAYIAPRQGTQPNQGMIRAYLEEKLPAYMIPSTFVFIDGFKLTPNGKVDKNALPEPHDISPEHEEQYIAPRNNTESILEEIWAETLGLEKVGAKDNFFNLGGHSLLGVSLLNNVEKNFGKRLPISSLFKAPTIEGMARLLDAESGAMADTTSPETGKQWETLVAIKPEGKRTPFFCVHGRAHSLSQYMHEEQPFYWLHHGQDAKRTKYLSVEAIADIHLREIRTVQPAGPYYIGGFSFGGMVAFEMAQKLINEGEEIAVLALFDPTLVGKFSHGSGNKSKLHAFLSRLKKEQSSTGKIQQILDITHSRARRLRHNLSEQSKSIICKACMSLDRPVPAPLAVFNLIRMFKQAASQYEYKPYPGPVTMFVPESYHKRERLLENLKARWSDIARQGVEFRFVKGATSHHKMVEEPFVRDLVEQLEDCLMSASGEHGLNQEKRPK